MNTSEHIHNCISTLKNNETILFPTDTVLGLGCDANSDTAVEKIINLKDRNDKQGFIVLVSSIEELHKYVKDVPIEAKSLIEETDKPLSIIYPKGKNVSKKVLAENGSIAIRIVKSGFAHELLSNYQKAIIATSVNLSGEPPAISLGEVPESILKAVDYVVNLPLPSDKQLQASTIIKVNSEGKTEIIRE